MALFKYKYVLLFLMTMSAEKMIATQVIDDQENTSQQNEEKNEKYQAKKKLLEDIQAVVLEYPNGSVDYIFLREMYRTEIDKLILGNQDRFYWKSTIKTLNGSYEVQLNNNGRNKLIIIKSLFSHLDAHTFSVEDIELINRSTINCLKSKIDEYKKGRELLYNDEENEKNSNPLNFFDAIFLCLKLNINR